MNNNITNILINGSVEEQRQLIEELRAELTELKAEAEEREVEKRKAIEEAKREEEIRIKVAEGINKLMDTMEQKQQFRNKNNISFTEWVEASNNGLIEEPQKTIKDKNISFTEAIEMGLI